MCINQVSYFMNIYHRHVYHLFAQGKDYEELFGILKNLKDDVWVILKFLTKGTSFSE